MLNAYRTDLVNVARNGAADLVNVYRPGRERVAGTTDLVNV